MGPLTLTLADGPGAVVIPVEPRLPSYCCLNGDGSRALVSGGPEALRLVDAASGKLIWKTTERRRDVERIALSPDGARFVVAAATGLELRETSTGRVLETFATDEAPLHAVAVSPDGRRVITVGGRSVVKVWELPTGKVLVRLEDKDAAHDAACFTADSRQFLTADLFSEQAGWAEIKPLLRDADTGKVVRILGKEEPSWHGVSVAASADGRFLAATGVSEIFVWDAATLERRATLQLPGGTGLVQCVTFSPDGERIVSGAFDGMVKVWRTQTGQELLTLRGHQGPVSSVGFSGDGRKLITGSTDGTVRIWDGRP
jgi:WD40 repeat protein